MGDVLAYEAVLECTMSLFVATAFSRTLRPLAMPMPCHQIHEEEAISDSQLFIGFANMADPFLLLPEDTPLSVGAASGDVLLVLRRDQYPTLPTPARLIEWLLDDTDMEKMSEQANRAQICIKDDPIRSDTSGEIISGSCCAQFCRSSNHRNFRWFVATDERFTGNDVH
jgi:hypothetical protein